MSLGQYAAIIELCDRMMTEHGGPKAILNGLAWKVPSYIALGNDEAADAAIGQLYNEFSGSEELIGAVYQIALACYNYQKYEKAREFYQYILDNWPEEKETGFWAQREIALSYIKDDNDANALAGVDELIADFNDVPNLADEVGKIGLEYYRQGHDRRMKGQEGEAKDYYEKALSVWERTDQGAAVTGADDIAANYYRMAVVYAQELRLYKEGLDYFQAVVDNWPGYEFAWHAQYFIGEYYEKLLKTGGITEAEATPKIEQAYLNVLDNYPESKSAPWASLKLGKLNFNNANWGEAVVYFEIFIDTESDKLV